MPCLAVASLDNSLSSHPVDRLASDRTLDNECDILFLNLSSQSSLALASLDKSSSSHLVVDQISSNRKPENKFDTSFLTLSSQSSPQARYQRSMLHCDVGSTHVLLGLVSLDSLRLMFCSLRRQIRWQLSNLLVPQGREMEVTLKNVRNGVCDRYGTVFAMYITRGR